MSLVVKIVVAVVGAAFLFIGSVGMFQPQQMAETLGFLLPTAESAGSMRAMIGAHYVAMGGICLFAVIRNVPVVLFPIGMIEGVMVVGRGIAAIQGEFTNATVAPTVIELVFALILLSTSWRHLPSRSN